MSDRTDKEKRRHECVDENRTKSEKERKKRMRSKQEAECERKIKCRDTVPQVDKQLFGSASV